MAPTDVLTGPDDRHVTDATPRLAPVPPHARVPAERGLRTRVGGLEVHARAWTSGRVPADPPVVLVHGLGVASRMCQPVAEQLAARHHVYAPDLPGFGRSDQPEEILDLPGLGEALGRWMGVVGLERAVLVGTSLGSQVVAEAARQHPGRCSLVVLASPTVDAGRRRWRSQLWRWQVEQATQSLRLRGIQVADYARCGVSRVIRTFSAALDHRLEDVVPDLAQPTLVCWATRDPLLSRGWVEALTARCAHGHLAVLPGAVHALSHENPVELGRVTSAFIDRHADRRHQRE